MIVVFTNGKVSNCIGDPRCPTTPTPAPTATPTPRPTPQPGPDLGITFAAFNAIQNGMNYQQVSSIIGSYGVEGSEATVGDFTDETFTWQSYSGGIITCVFQNDSLQAKDQAGLK